MRISQLSAVAALACSAALVASACSDDSGTSASSFISDYCNLLMPCCSQAGLSSDPSQCKQLFAALTAGAGFDETKAEACLNEMRAASKRDDFCTGGSSAAENSSACDSVFSSGSSSGKVAPGGTCESDSDCAPSSEGDVMCLYNYVSGPNGTTETDTCVVMIPGSAGSTPCLGTVDGSTTYYSPIDQSPTKGYLCDKGKGLYCNYDSLACEKLGSVGDECSYSKECVDSAYCDYATTKCAARLPVGSDCGMSSDSCVNDAYCESSTDKCAAKLANGAPCTSFDSCASGQCVNNVCKASSNGALTMICSQ